MKKIAFLLWACLVGMGQAVASDVLTVADVSLPQGGEATIDVSMALETQFKGYQLDVELDGGLTLVLDEDGRPVAENGFTGTDHAISSQQVSAGKYRFVCVSFQGKQIPMSGSLLRLKVLAPESANVGDTFHGTITATEFTTINTEIRNLADVSFTITITEPADPWVTLDENAGEVPAATDEVVDIKVLRTIKGGEWNTLCLPFNMTEEQVYDAFGEDVELAEFADYEMNDEGTEITVNFVDADLTEGFYANYPYIIRTSADITEFMTQAQIEPDEDEAVAEYAVGRNRDRHVYGTFHGTLHAGMTIPENNLFISGNAFWYSTGKTQMKGFRAYLELEDVLDGAASAKVNVNAGGGAATGIRESVLPGTAADGRCHDLQGREVGRKAATTSGSGLKKGVYIVDGRKVIVK